MSALLWPAVVLLVLYAVVGGGLAWAVGMRGLWIVAAAPVFTTSAVGIASTVAGFLGVGWSVLPVFAVALAIAAGVLIVRRFTPSRPTISAPPRGWLTGPVLILAAVVMTAILWLVIGEPTAISQTFDNVFHLNAIRWILDTGAASPLQLGGMTTPDGSASFYPSAWHATAAIVAQISGGPIIEVVNAQTIVIAAVVWPAGTVLLARVLVGQAPLVSVVSAVVSVSLPAFPLLPMDYGVLYPYQLSLALLPFALAATVAATGADADRSARGRGWWAFIVVGSLPGIALAHPGGFVTWLALTTPLAGVLAWRFWRRRSVSARVIAAVGVLTYGIVGVLLLKALRPPLEARQWPTAKNMPEALLSVATLQLYYPTAAFLVAILALIGLGWILVRERSSPTFVIAGMWVVGASMFVIVISLPLGSLRDAFTGSYYNNWPRLASVFAVALVPAATFGGVRLARALASRITGTRNRRTLGQRRAMVASALVIAFVIMPIASYSNAVQRAHAQFVMNDESKLLSTDEFALLSRLDESVPSDAVIVGNPYTGTSLAYAISRRQVVMRHILAGPSSDGVTVLDHLDEAMTDPAVCEAVLDSNIRYVLNFGDREVHSGTHDYRGLDDLETSGVARLVDSQGDARLYVVTACGAE